MAGADQEARFAIALDATGAEKANELGQALSGLRDKIKADQAAINELSAAIKRLEVGGSKNTAVFKQLRDQLAAKRASLTAAQEAYVKLGGSFGPVATGAKAASAGLDDVLGAAQGAGGPIGGLAGRFGQLKGIIGKAGAAGAALLLAAALIAVVAGAVAATIALAAYAFQAANAARDARLLFDAVSAGAGADQRLGVQVELLAERVNLARSQLNELALSLGRSRLQGRALEAAFSAVATATAVMGQSAGATLQGIATEAARTRTFVLNAFSLDGTGLKLRDVAAELAKRTGASMQAAVTAIQNGRVKVADGLGALDAAVQAKFGKLAAAQMLSFGTQVQRAKESISALFKDVRIEPLLEGLRGVLRLFDQSTVTGQQLKLLAETLLNPLFEAVRAASPYVQGFFKGMVIAALLVAITLQRLKRAWDEAFGGGTKSKVDGVKVGVYAGILAVALLIGTIGALAATVAILATPLIAPFVLLAAVVLALALPFVVAGAAVYGLYLAVMAAYDAIAGLDFAALGTQLVDGLVNGLRSGISRVVSAVRGLGSAAISTLKGIWEIASPSKLSTRFGRYFGQGPTIGIEESTAGVEVASRGLAAAAVEGLESAPGGGRVGSAPSARVGSAPGGGRAAGASRGGRVLHVERLEINGVKDADELTSRTFLARLVDALEDAATTGGIPLDPEPT
ncbi:hypothetical protein WME90_01975 [Sorangium sp. So ce375]|uniref:hypothetical protein n=1 Tax=Sorangium sp. So ce375 TaxID=3133306 RepID=UPI003F5BCC18